MKHIWSVRLLLASLVIVLPALTIVTAQPESKPLVAVLPFNANAGADPDKKGWWYHGGAETTQDAFSYEMSKSDGIRLMSRKELESRMEAKSLVWEYTLESIKLKEFGKALGARYLLTGMATIPVNEPEAPSSKSREQSYTVTLKASLIDTSTGEVVWTGEERNVFSGPWFLGEKVAGSKSSESRRFDLLLKPCVEKLSAKLKAATLPGLL